MIAVGGLTRLTDSGLSITEWRPVTGALPPMSAEAWQAEFEKYREIPEYQLQNKGMSLEEFKVIYWWEWGHRQLGRVIGLVWFVGFAGFAVARQIPPGWTGRLFLPGRAGRAAGGDRLVDGFLGPERRPGGCGKLPAGDASGAGLRDPGLLAWYVFLLGRSEAELMTGAARAGGQAVRAVDRADAFRLPADPAGRAGGGDRRGPRLSRPGP
jgi:heme a synthase